MLGKAVLTIKRPSSDGKEMRSDLCLIDIAASVGRSEWSVGNGAYGGHEDEDERAPIPRTQITNVAHVEFLQPKNSRIWPEVAVEADQSTIPIESDFARSNSHGEHDTNRSI